jgi:oligoribonuclease NrnB/cAMP/cGMP phosphodiesterase (DHH superfamily)
LPKVKVENVMRNILDTTTIIIATAQKCIVNHSADWDGYLAAIINCRAIGDDVDIIPMNYGDRIPSLDEFLQYKEIYIVDFSLPKELVLQLQQAGVKVIWIDHHISAIKAYEGIEVDRIQDIHFSACELAWTWFFPMERMPRAVELLGEYDIFEKSGRYASWDEILQFQMGARIIDLTLESAEHMLTLSYDEIALIQSQGWAIMQAKRREEKIAFLRSAWDVTIDGRPAKVLLTSDMSSLICEQTLATGIADIVILLNRRDENNFQCSLRVSDRSDWNASVWAKAHRGGGHQRAAGCQLSVEEFLQLYTEKNI